jgi:hypothetical protein
MNQTNSPSKDEIKAAKALERVMPLHPDALTRARPSTMPVDDPEVQKMLNDKAEALKAEISALQAELVAYLRDVRSGVTADSDGFGEYARVTRLAELKKELKTVERFQLNRNVDAAVLDQAKSFPIDHFFPGIKWRGRRATVLCPFHNERTPSCSIDRERNTFHCFGCGKRGDVIDILRHFEGMTFAQAVKRLTGDSL